MTVKRGDPVFVTLKHHAKPLFGFVMSPGGNTADVLTLQEGGHIHLLKDVKERQDGEDFGFLEVDASEPKSAKQVAAEQKAKTIAAAQAKLDSGDLDKPAGDTGLAAASTTDEEPSTDEEPPVTGSVIGDDNEDEDESEDDEETSSDGEEPGSKPPVAKARTRSASGRKR